MQLKQVEVRKHTGGKGEMKETNQAIAAVKRGTALRMATADTGEARTR